MQENEDYYFTENGLMVFTEKYLLQRGYCCGSGCRHCPYNYQAVDEPKKSFLLLQKLNAQKDEEGFKKNN